MRTRRDLRTAPGVLLAAGLITTALTSAPASALTTAAPWRLPLNGPVRVLGPFLAPNGPYAPGHRGVDLASPVGAPVYAAGGGTVSFAGQVAGRGVVAIDHGNGLRTTYEPVQASVRGGEPVRAGEPIGVIASTPRHCRASGCLHWGLRRADRYLDPLSLLRPPGGSVLLPFLDPEHGPFMTRGEGRPAGGGTERPARSEQAAPGPQGGSGPPAAAEGAAALTAAGVILACRRLGSPRATPH